VAAAIAMARAHGVRVSYDPNLRLSLWSLDAAKAAVLQTIALVDEFLPGQEELAKVSGLEDPQTMVTWAHQQGAQVVVLKMGIHGCLASDGQQVQKIDAFKVNALDATGAGDCFNGAYLARRARGEDVFARAPAGRLPPPHCRPRGMALWRRCPRRHGWQSFWPPGWHRSDAKGHLLPAAAAPNQ
jgi:2-dehydro-3-deoxygluconokinase